MFIESIIIYETYHPGACVEIFAYDYIVEKWLKIWSVFDNPNIKIIDQALKREMCQIPNQARKFEPALKRKDVYTKYTTIFFIYKFKLKQRFSVILLNHFSKLRLEFEHSQCEYYTELDAVEVIGRSYMNSNAIDTGLKMRKLADKLNSIILSKSEKINNEPAMYIKTNLFNKELSRQTSSNFLPQKCANITDLHDDVLNYIIENYLDLRSIFRLRSACKRFYCLCSDSHLFRKLDLQPFWNLVIIKKKASIPVLIKVATIKIVYLLRLTLIL